MAQGSQFSLNDVEVVVATVNLDDVRAYRSSISRGLQAATSNARYQRIQTPFTLSGEEDDYIDKCPTPPIKPRLHSVEEEIALCAGCYLWDVSDTSLFIMENYQTNVGMVVVPQALWFCRLPSTPERRN